MPEHDPISNLRRCRRRPEMPARRHRSRRATWPSLPPAAAAAGAGGGPADPPGTGCTAASTACCPAARQRAFRAWWQVQARGSQTLERTLARAQDRVPAKAASLASRPLLAPMPPAIAVSGRRQQPVVCLAARRRSSSAAATRKDQDTQAAACLGDAARLGVPRPADLHQVGAYMLRQQLAQRARLHLDRHHLRNTSQNAGLHFGHCLTHACRHMLHQRGSGA